MCAPRRPCKTRRSHHARKLDRQHLAFVTGHGRPDARRRVAIDAARRARAIGRLCNGSHRHRDVLLLRGVPHRHRHRAAPHPQRRSRPRVLRVRRHRRGLDALPAGVRNAHGLGGDATRHRNLLRRHLRRRRKLAQRSSDAGNALATARPLHGGAVWRARRSTVPVVGIEPHLRHAIHAGGRTHLSCHRAARVVGASGPPPSTHRATYPSSNFIDARLWASSPSPPRVS